MATAASSIVKFFTYIHCKPDGIPFYVGKGKRQRCTEFKWGRNDHYKNIVAKYGKENIEIYMFPRDSEKDAFETEIRWIKQLKDQGFSLANLTIGGDGVSGAVYTEERKKKMSEMAKGNKYALGYKHTDEAKKKIAETSRGRDFSVRKRREHYVFGRTVSDETKAKMSLARIGKKLKPRTEECKARMSLARKGIPLKLSEEAKERNRQRMIGNKYGLGLKTKGHTGRCFSQEHRQKLSNATKAYWDRKKGLL